MRDAGSPVAARGVDTRQAMMRGDHCLAPARTVDAPIDGTAGRYTRLFGDLPPIEEDNAALLSLGVAGGICDGGEDCADGAETAAGWPMFGQYVAHDITADRSPIGPQTQLARVVNFRSPRANLESLYGSGQVGSPYLFRAEDPDLLLLGMNDRGEPEDLPRNSQGIALIGDPRNDVHLFVSQMQVAMIGVHNRLVERARGDGARPSEVFATARRETAWHYQWVILNDYLPRLVGTGLAEEVLEHGPRFYRAGDDPKIPFEFADAAFRYGHGQVRDDFQVNAESGIRRLFPDLLGFRPVPAELAVDWSLLFDVEGCPPAQRAKRIDGTLVRSLIELPAAVTGEVEVDAYRSLAGRDLERGHAYGLPAGEAVAEAMGERPLSAEENELVSSGWRGGTPLWLYVMLESAARASGERLGPMGGRIVAEVLTGLIEADPESYRSIEPDWTPTLPFRGSRFGLADLLLPTGY
jgi:hypothetical protein